MISVSLRMPLASRACVTLPMPSSRILIMAATMFRAWLPPVLLAYICTYSSGASSGQCTFWYADAKRAASAVAAAAGEGKGGAPRYRNSLRGDAGEKVPIMSTCAPLSPEGGRTARGGADGALGEDGARVRLVQLDGHPQLRDSPVGGGVVVKVVRPLGVVHVVVLGARPVSEVRFEPSACAPLSPERGRTARGGADPSGAPP